VDGWSLLVSGEVEFVAFPPMLLVNKQALAVSTETTTLMRDSNIRLIAQIVSIDFLQGSRKHCGVATMAIL
jgi:hypothetical protein